MTNDRESKGAQKRTEVPSCLLLDIKIITTSHGKGHYSFQEAELIWGND